MDSQAHIAGERRVALVTGGSGALGAAICRRLAADSDIVAVHANTQMDGARALAAAICAEGGMARCYQADLTSPQHCRALVEEVITELGRVDILVNSHGIIRDALLVSMSDDDVDMVIDANLRAVIHTTRAAVEHMIPKRAGVVVNISSSAASRPSSGQANYASAKAGLEGFTRAMAVELGSRGIRVNAVAPGVIDSEMTAPIRARNGTAIRDRIPLRRFGTPDDVASAVHFLASPASSYITGEVLHVSGGASLGGR